jgi:hypothetical protein
MVNKKSLQIWHVNVVSFILLTVLGFTGFINWLLLPKGYEASSGFLISLRHFLRGVHEWTAVLFLISIAIHISLHWSYIKTNLKKYSISK